MEVKMTRSLLLILLAACTAKDGEPVDSSVPTDDTDPGVVDADGDGSPEGEDCDDGDATVYPEATEQCDAVDQDCDGAVDEGLEQTWYADQDGDGYGNPDAAQVDCAQPSDAVADDTDCDDALSGVNPGATEVWYDGIDQDCAGDDDFDADGDGDRSDDWAGTDCDDADPARYGGVGCRPQADCAHPAVPTLEAYAPGSASDVVFNDACEALIGTQISGLDKVRVVDHVGGYRDLNWTADQRDVGAVAFHPTDGTIYAVFNSTSSVGVESGGGFSLIASGVFTQGSNRVVSYANWSPSSAAMDASCLWIPNFAGAGTVVCVQPDGSQSTLTTLSGYVETVALGPDGALYASVGDTLYQLDTGTGASTAALTAGAVILDAVIDYNGDTYVETTAREIELHPGSGGSSSVFATVADDGKIAISPDGWLVRIRPVVNGTAGWEEWALED
ncbi:MAG: putative metal-binding motif-containing protein [Alphaproteobacteria bacterium]|nr:putative metal-binding motif-containing protein [Alphaproteobacteria bacterium]